MTRGTTLFELQAELLTLLAARPGLADVQVVEEKPATGLQPDAMWFDDEAESDNEIPVMKAGEKDVDETYTFGIVIQALVGDGTVRDAKTRAVAMFSELQQQLAETPRPVDSIDWVELVGWAVVCGPVTEGGSDRGARFGVTLRAHACLYAD